MPLGMSSLSSRLRTCFLGLNYDGITEWRRLLCGRTCYFFEVVHRL